MAPDWSQSGSFGYHFIHIKYSKALRPEMAPFMAPFWSQNASNKVPYWVFLIRKGFICINGSLGSSKSSFNFMCVISVLSFSIHQPCPESQSFGLLGNFFTLNLQLRRHITATFLFSEHHFHMHIAVNARLDHHSHAYNVNETSLLH